MDTFIDYVAIVACGEGSRLLPLTKDIPKFLVTLNNKSVLLNIVEYWKIYTKKFIIVTDSRYNTLVHYYMKTFKVEYTVINIPVKKGQENSYTIHSAFKSNEFIHKKILITWCDVYPVSPIDIDKIINNNVIFTYKNFSRYNAYNNKLVKEPNGNVAGIYYFNNFENITIFNETMDICDCYIDNYRKFITYELEEMIDVGDMDKLDLLIKQYNVPFFPLKISSCDLWNFIAKDIILLVSYFSHIKTINTLPIEYDINCLIHDLNVETIDIESIPILFNLCGFSRFENDEKFHFMINDTNISINIQYPIENQIENILDFLDNKSKQIFCQSIILCWLTRCYKYNINIHKCISSYYYSIYLYNKFYRYLHPI